MSKVDHYKLRYGPYPTPKFRYGQTVTCLMRGKVKIIGMTDAPIPWPTCRDNNHASIVLFGSVTRAVRKESNQAVARAWGVSGQTVTKWRKAMGVRYTQGTTALRIEMGTNEAWAKRAARAMKATLSRPGRGAQMSAAFKGHPKPPEIAEMLRTMNIGRKATAEARRKMSIAHKKRGRSPGLKGRVWTPDEDELVRTLPAREAASRTGRTVVAVRERWRDLGLPDRRGLWRKKPQ